MACTRRSAARPPCFTSSCLAAAQSGASTYAVTVASLLTPLEPQPAMSSPKQATTTAATAARVAHLEPPRPLSMVLRETEEGRVPLPKTLKSGSCRSFWEGGTRPSPALPLAKEDLGLAVKGRRHRLQLSRRLAQIDQLDVRAPQRRHLAPVPRVSSVDRV